MTDATPGEREPLETRAARWWADLTAADNAIADAGGELRSEDDPHPLAGAIKRLAAERDEDTARMEWLVERHAYVYKGGSEHYAVLFALDKEREGNGWHPSWREAIDAARLAPAEGSSDA